ncbi:uncharacterized protein EAE97_007336 [Botrytis byssoidea]|uniref:C3H1-type domain-containing protein n=1 Tax=Botrytis byssoidea TaxID=139641 RepID=A0A9P5IF59_9HELO|nr:uncharacterized protein EAE97_007336 [Botrytis byssoidea]KAF7939256.1 hypothetical protein EAE97_007336 [Botrytis byssoidea]
MASDEANNRNDWPITPDILGIETATICNGGVKEQEITFHTRPLTRLSPKFAQFCRRKKQVDGRFTLTCAQNKYDAFTCIALYAYHGKVPNPPKDIDPIYTQRLRWIYYVAEEFGLNDLMNKTIDALRVYDFKYKQEIHAHTEEIYHNTSKGSLLRWYSAASAAWSWGRETGPATASQRDNRKKFISSGRGNPDIFADFHLVDLFHRDYIRGFDTDWRDVHDSGLPVCAFHCHSPGETCHRTGITEPAEVPEHISKIFDGVEDTVLLNRSQIIDTPSDRDARSSARQSTPPRSSESEVVQPEDENLKSGDGRNKTPGFSHETVHPVVGQVINEDQEMSVLQEITMKKSITEEVTKQSSTTRLAPIRNPPSTRVVPPESKKTDRSQKHSSENVKTEAPSEDLYGASDIDMDREASENSVEPGKKVTESRTYDEQLANAWRVPLSSFSPQNTRIVPGTVVTSKLGNTKRSQAIRDVLNIRDSPTVIEDEVSKGSSRKSIKKRKAVVTEDDTNHDGDSIITKKPKTSNSSLKSSIRTSVSQKANGKKPSKIQNSESESSEEDSSERSSGTSSEISSSDEDDEVMNGWSTDEDTDSYDDQSISQAISQVEINQESDSSDSDSDSESEEQDPEPCFIDSGVHLHIPSKATSSSILVQSQPSFSQPGTSNSRNIPGVAPLRPGYCLIYNYKGRCNKACGLQHLCLKCDLQHSSLHHHQYQPNFRAANKDPSIETCRDWNAGRCAVRVTNCTLRHICSICNGGHRSIYHEHEDPFLKSDKQRPDRTGGESSHFRREGRLDHGHSQANSPHISANWPEDSHSSSRRQQHYIEEVGQQDSTIELKFASCQMWQRGTCIRKRTKCQLSHICERCGQLTHRTAKHDTYMSKTAPRA